MTPIKRSRRLQAGLAGLSVAGALGAALGFGLTTRTHGAGPSGSSASGEDGSTRSSVHRGEDGDDDGNGSQRSSSPQRSSPVTQPSSSAPQATTSGS